jgi:hypothetical protein
MFWRRRQARERAATAAKDSLAGLHAIVAQSVPAEAADRFPKWFLAQVTAAIDADRTLITDPLRGAKVISSLVHSYIETHRTGA